ncbi:flagellar hook-associated protein 1 [Spirochaetota bacterium]|nr:flagellar hook-associated protein 1 [Spirochaetota bacterium]
MESTFLGVEIGKRSLIAQRKALNVVSHNLANSHNDFYSRQRVFFGTIDPLYRNDLTRVHRPGQIGQGGEVVAIRRDRDMYLDTRIFKETGALAYWERDKANITELERVYHALEDSNLQEKLDQFWDRWQELTVRGNEPAAREELIQTTQNLTAAIRNKFSQLYALKAETNQKIGEQVTTINNLAQNIADLNRRIESAEAANDNPNDLLDKRDALIEQLSSITAVNVSHNDSDETLVFVNGSILVQGNVANQILTQTAETDKYVDAFVWSNTLEPFEPDQGDLSANFVMRDNYIPREINNLDTLAVNLSYGVNEIHRESFNLYDNKAGDFFITAHPDVRGNGNFDTTQSGTPDSSLIFKVTGNAVLSAEDVIGSEGVLTIGRSGSEQDNNTIQITYRADETIGDLLNKIHNSDGAINAYLNFENQLVLKSRSTTPRYPFAIPYLEDTGDFLSSISQIMIDGTVPFTSSEVNAIDQLRADARFERTPLRHPSSWINIEPDLIEDGGLIGTRGGSNYNAEPGRDKPYGVSEGSGAAAIANLRFDPTLIDNRRTINEYYIEMITAIGSQGNNAQLEIDQFTVGLNALKSLRQSISGVNIDEELANMIAYQQGYQAGARVVKVMDELLETLINQLG